MAGYSQTPLVKKLGIQSGIRMAVLHAPMPYNRLVDDLPDINHIDTTLTEQYEFIHVFVTTQEVVISSFAQWKQHLRSTGLLWVSWPKKTSGIPSDLNENIIREIGLEHGLVDTKVCAVNDEWSGLKFVYRLKDRT